MTNAINQFLGGLTKRDKKWLETKIGHTRLDHFCNQTSPINEEASDKRPTWLDKLTNEPVIVILAIFLKLDSHWQLILRKQLRHEINTNLDNLLTNPPKQAMLSLLAETWIAENGSQFDKQVGTLDG